MKTSIAFIHENFFQKVNSQSFLLHNFRKMNQKYWNQRAKQGNKEEVRNIAEKLLELKNDLVFQELFGKQKNRKITGHLLSLILKRKVNNINLDLNKRMLGNREESKKGRLDSRL